MKKAALLAGLVFLVSACSDTPQPTAIPLTPQLASAPAGPIQWAGNGHFYQLIMNGARWGQARTLAAGMTYNGRPGHLATITSAGENDFVKTNFSDVGVFWLGGFQPAGSPEPDGGWTWVTGEPWVFTAWNPGEPNNSPNNSDVLEWRGNGWNDRSTAHTGPYLVEFQYPDPATKDDCKDGGWEHFGFKNQGQCVRFIETGKDSR